LRTGLVIFFLGIIIIVVSSISVPDPLHTVNSRFDGILGKNQHATIYLTDVHKRKNMSLYVSHDPVQTILNARITNPRDVVVINHKFSDTYYTTFIPTIEGNYSASITNVDKNPASVNMQFGSSTLFYENGSPKVFERYFIMTGVISLISGAVVTIFAGIFEIVKRYKSRQFTYM
jgi:hypothetical protein